ncbi:MAG: 16S rRNA (cytosine(1402)-N(4))-methyltransferase RsmH [Acidimicrobiales bacterium]
MVAFDAPQPFVHRPVMVDEIIALVSTVPAGAVLDATVGGGGHAAAILEARADLRLIGLDRDPHALAAATRRLAPYGNRALLRRARFDELAPVLAGSAAEGAGAGSGDTTTAEAPLAVELSAFLFDLGVSSPQLDRAERGFSFRHDGPLDMRMDPDAPLSAAEVVNTYPVPELARVIGRYGDERFAGRIAAAIAAARPIAGTARLAEVVVGAIPAAARRTGGHPATRTFQAIRIEVNGELVILGPALESALDLLAVGGRGMVLTYHSGEDRIVKDVFRRRSTPTAPPRLPVAPPAPPYATIRPLARRPRPEEVEANPRSASARLRSIERVAA